MKQSPNRSDSVRVMTPMSAVALRHVHFEDLGNFTSTFTRHGYEVTYFDVGVDALASLRPLAPDLLIVLGGPISVYQCNQYPFLGEELAVLAARLAADRPTLGICLGSQLIAHALGARVYPMDRKEIGFSPIRLTTAGMRSCLSPFAEDGMVLHWHGDTFDLPIGAAHLASTEICANQAFACGPRVLGLQFHPEITTGRFEHWLIGHACELGAAGIAIPELRAAAKRHAPMLKRKAQALLDHWFSQIRTQ